MAYLAAYDVHRAHLMGRAEPTTGIAPFAALANQVMSQGAVRLGPPGVLGRGQRVLPPRPGLRQAPGRGLADATLVHLPVHASWVSQIEIVFSVIQRKVITPADFKDSDALAARLLAFQERYNAAAAPFNWKFTRAKLNDLVSKRIDAHRDRAGLPLAA